MNPETRPFLPYAKQSISKEDIEAVSASLSQDAVTRGPLVRKFEENIANYVESPYAVSFNSGTSALHAAYFALDTSEKDRIITTPNTFIASLSMGMHYGAHPSFADIDKESGTISIPSLLSLLDSPQSRGRKIIVPVHFAGPAIDMKEIWNSLKEPDTCVLEDAAHALGSLYPSGEKVGSGLYSDMTIFSFHPAKLITTGEGGLVTTRSETLYQKLLLFRNNGIHKEPSSIWQYDASAATGNFHMTEFQAALGLSQLSTIQQKIEKRASLMNDYFTLAKERKNCHISYQHGEGRTGWHLCLAKIPFAQKGFTRDAFMNALHDKGIGTQLHYIPLYRHSLVKNKVGELFLEEMENYFQEALSLPLHTSMDRRDVVRVLDAIDEILF